MSTSSVERVVVELGRRRERAHPARVRPLVAVVGALEVPRRRERDGLRAVAEREHRHLRPLEQLLDEHRPVERPRDLEPGVDLRLRPADDDALPGRQPVGLQDARRPRRVEQGGGRNAGRGHHVLRERLRALDPSRRGRRPEDGDPGVAQDVGDARDERGLRPDDDEIDAERARQPEQALAVVGTTGWHVASAAIPGFPGAAWSSVSGGRRGEPPGERVLATARADDENAHRPSLRATARARLARRARADERHGNAERVADERDVVRAPRRAAPAR